LLLLQAREYLIAQSTGTITTPRAMMERQKKQGNQLPHSKKLVWKPEEIKKTDNRIQTPTKQR
jgi:hypothetical protein